MENHQLTLIFHNSHAISLSTTDATFEQLFFSLYHVDNVLSQMNGVIFVVLVIQLT